VFTPEQWDEKFQIVGPEQSGAAVRAMFAGCAGSLVASMLAAVPVVLATPRDQVAAAQPAMMSLVARFVLVVLIGLTLVLSGLFEKEPLLIWLAISHVLLLVIDTIQTLKAVRTAPTVTNKSLGTPDSVADSRERTRPNLASEE